MKIVITNASIMYNRGSEAVIRSITSICRFWFPKALIVICTGWYGEVIKNVSDADYIVPRFDEIGTLRYLIKEIKNADIVLVTGADNYDYKGNNVYLRKINDEIFANTNAKTVLFDCSLDESNMNEEVFQDINRFSLITVRETETQHVLKKWFPNEKLLLYPDPAFILPLEKCDLPFGFEEKKTVGINISNLIMGKRVGAPEEIVLRNYIKAIDYLLNTTDQNILIMQHVLNNGYDLEAAYKLYKNYEKETRVSIMQTELLNSMQIKYIISKLNILITARTHASIAGYSAIVPTLVVGYSIKSKGIAKDLFGNWENYVIPVRSLVHDEGILSRLKYIIENQDYIMEILTKNIPEIKMRSIAFGECLRDLIEDNV